VWLAQDRQTIAFRFATETGLRNPLAGPNTFLWCKLAAMREVLRVLRPGGEFHIADWGKPTSPAMRLAFFGVQLLDGFATTTDNVKGLLPDLLGLAGFEKVETTNSYSTLLGTISLYRARKASTRLAGTASTVYQ
jgi:hypothetical protein